MNDEVDPAVAIVKRLQALRADLDELITLLASGVPETVQQWTLNDAQMVEEVVTNIRGVVRQHIVLNTAQAMRPYIKQYVTERILPPVKQRLGQDPVTQEMIDDGVKSVVRSMFIGERDLESRPGVTAIVRQVIDWAQRQDYTALIEKHTSPVLDLAVKAAVRAVVNPLSLYHYFENAQYDWDAVDEDLGGA